ncbi:type VI secretion system baseplate subunit TssG [Pseudomonas oryzihabitans]|uniref:Type VI secretion system protein ImpH n=1 Tax=Pseudomonas oryzihabitans TaxID=47885 RepID=A0AAJ2BLD6_9PSED|nr:type VI secretion system baseplate subunit TssG [Pseudomonas psychrotolerans]MDR6234520.1 type VI secretion system protein ImpH [Pseudomonas psychrotolerans]MDR6356340.1 type VI secretion system protein ImpH [Pseudomonas psychrotolerans]
MDTTHGSAAADLNRSALCREIREYSLFQGIGQVLRQLHRLEPTLAEEQLYERLEFQANPSLAFPGSDIEQLEFIADADGLRARLQLNLGALMGSGSPLPAFYSEQALGDGEQGRTTRDFLDLFNHRLHRLLLPIWRKYRYHARFREGARDELSARLFSLIGLGDSSLRQAPELNWKRLLPYLGLLSLKVHSATLIEAVLRYYFAQPALQLEQCLERAVAIPAEQQTRLGRASAQLGQTAVLGVQVRDRGGKFRLHLLELDWEAFHSFLPSGSQHAALGALLRFTLRDQLDYDLRLHLRRESLREWRLSAASPCRLGWTTWLGLPHANGQVTLACHR